MIEPNGILLIEDDPACVASVRAILRRGRARTLHVTNADTLAEGLALAPGSSVIVLDLRLADSDGEETLRTIPDLAQFAPVIVCTGALSSQESDASLAERALRAGADGVIFKPFDVREFLTAVLAAVVSPRRACVPAAGGVERAA